MIPASETVASRPVSKPTKADLLLAFIRAGDGPSLTECHRHIRPDATLSSLNATLRDRDKLVGLGLIRCEPGHDASGSACVRHWPVES